MAHGGTTYDHDLAFARKAETTATAFPLSSASKTTANENGGPLAPATNQFVRHNHDALAQSAQLRRKLAMTETMLNCLKKLRLSGLAETLDVRLQEAAGNRLSHAEFLELALKDELTVRQSRMIARRTKAACFRELKTLEDFNWEFNPGIKRQRVYDLATGDFVRKAQDVLLIGPRAWASRTWHKRWAVSSSSRAFSCCTAQSSTWCGIS
jgi:hypothetical protein